jgi:signal transduction histidine kinase
VLYPKIPAIILSILLCPVLFCNGQSAAISRLFEKLLAAQQDTDKVNIYYSISRLYWNNNPDSALLIGQKALGLAHQSHFEKGIALSLLTIGVAYMEKGNYPEALNCHLQALRITEKSGLEELNGNCYNNIGIVYTYMGDTVKAMSYFERALNIAQKYADQKTIAKRLVNIAEIHKKKKEFDQAIDYDNRVLKISENTHDSLTMSVTLMNIGDIYNEEKKPEKALPYLEASLDISKKIRDEEGIAASYNCIAETYRQSGKYKQSIHYAETGLTKALALGMSELAIESHAILYTDYQALGNFKMALEERNKEISLSDSLHSLEKSKQIRDLQSNYELEKEQHQIDLLNKDKTIQQTQIARDRIVRYLFIGGIVLLGLWAFFLLRGNAQKQRLNMLLHVRNNEIILQNKQLEELNAIKNKLFSIIGHDLRSPVSTLKGLLELMKNSSLSEQQIRYFSAKMSNSLVSTSHLLDNLLFWARSQMEGIQVNARSFDLQAVILQNIDLVQSRADEKKVTLIGCETTGLLPAYADEIMIDIVFRNLLENAIKFSKAGDSVTIITERRANEIYITIRDTGQGIAPENQAKIFNKFFSYTTAGTSSEKGSGLGLSLCKELVEKNNGKIGFESQSGKGSSFTFTLPASDRLPV